MTNVELPKPDLPPPAALALALMYFKGADLDEISAELRKRFPGYRGDAIRILLDRKMIPRGEKAEDGYWHFYSRNMPQAYRIFWEKPRNPPVGYGEEPSVHLQQLKAETQLLLLEGWCVFLNLGEEARRLPDIIAYPYKSSSDWGDPFAYECEPDPIEHPGPVRESLAKCRDMGLRVRFVTSSKRMAERILEIVDEEEKFHPSVFDRVYWFISGAEETPSRQRVPLSAETQPPETQPPKAKPAETRQPEQRTEAKPEKKQKILARHRTHLNTIRKRIRTYFIEGDFKPQVRRDNSLYAVRWNPETKKKERHRIGTLDEDVKMLLKRAKISLTGQKSGATGQKGSATEQRSSATGKRGSATKKERKRGSATGKRGSATKKPGSATK